VPHGFAKCRNGEPLRLVTLAAGVIDEPLPAAARLGEVSRDPAPNALGRGSRFGE
jgi:hypothetical protein